jgi:hypothetical protein
MAVVITQEIKKKRTMLALAGILLVVTATILYIGLKKTPPPEETVAEPAGVAGTPEEIAPATEVGDLKIDILEDARFKKLQESPGVPVATSTARKSNPFSE